jgi:hypothetical protein
MLLKRTLLSAFCSLACFTYTACAQAEPATKTSPSNWWPIIGVIFSLFAAIWIFFCIRELWCWFWKINDLLSEFEEIKFLLRRLDK